jgi:hypothetical protein
MQLIAVFYVYSKHHRNITVLSASRIKDISERTTLYIGFVMYVQNKL